MAQVVYNEQNRKYDMNELERMLRMKEQDIKKCQMPWYAWYLDALMDRR